MKIATGEEDQPWYSIAVTYFFVQIWRHLLPLWSRRHCLSLADLASLLDPALNKSKIYVRKENQKYKNIAAYLRGSLVGETKRVYKISDSMFLRFFSGDGKLDLMVVNMTSLVHLFLSESWSIWLASFLFCLLVWRVGPGQWLYLYKWFPIFSSCSFRYVHCLPTLHWSQFLNNGIWMILEAWCIYWQGGPVPHVT